MSIQSVSVASPATARACASLIRRSRYPCHPAWGSVAAPASQRAAGVPSWILARLPDVLDQMRPPVNSFIATCRKKRCARRSEELQRPWTRMRMWPVGVPAEFYAGAYAELVPGVRERLGCGASASLDWRAQVRAKRVYHARAAGGSRQHPPTPGAIVRCSARVAERDGDRDGGAGGELGVDGEEVLREGAVGAGIGKVNPDRASRPRPVEPMTLMK